MRIVLVFMLLLVPLVSSAGEPMSAGYCEIGPAADPPCAPGQLFRWQPPRETQEAAQERKHQRDMMDAYIAGQIMQGFAWTGSGGLVLGKGPVSDFTPSPSPSPRPLTCMTMGAWTNCY